MNDTLLVYEFSLEKVEKKDFSHFLGGFALDRLPKGKKLREMAGTFTFMVSGYDSTPEELYAIPAVREFYSAFHAAWPYWLYFSFLGIDTLRTMVACCLQNVSGFSSTTQSEGLISLEPTELLRLLDEDLIAMNVICRRAQMTKPEIYDLTKGVFDYFCLPFKPETPR
jgi:hypothetical protein